MPDPNLKFQPKVLAFDDRMALVQMPDGSRVTVARTAANDQMLGLVQPGEATDIRERPPGPELNRVLQSRTGAAATGPEIGPLFPQETPVQLGLAQIEKPQTDLSFSPQDVDVRQAEVETPEEELLRAQQQAVEAALRRFSGGR